LVGLNGNAAVGENSAEEMKKFLASEVAEEKSSRHRSLTLWPASVVAVIASLLAVYHMVGAGYEALPGIQHRAVHIGLGFALVFLLFPLTTRKKLSKICFILDILAAVLSLVIMVYVFLAFSTYDQRVGLPPSTADMIFGVIIFVLAIEAARRTTGFAFPAITVLFFLYALLGPIIPEPFNHSGMDLERMVGAYFVTMEGIYGTITGVSANYILLFIIFASFVRRSGVGEFIKDIALAVLGTVRGGPAKMAVVCSSFIGMLTGSSMANVAGVGSFTIPLMKRVGYRADFAGGVEACSGMGAQLMPPVMGGSIFIMAEILGTPYWNIALSAFPIAIIFYLGLFFSVDAEAVRRNLHGLPRSILPSGKKALREGWFQIIPIVVLVYCLAVIGVSPQRAGFWAIVAVPLVSLLSKRFRMNPRSILTALQEGAKDALIVVGVVPAASLIAGIVSITGLGLTLSNILVALSQGYMIVLLLLTALASMIMGMGLPVIVCYTVLSILVAPALIDMGILPLAAHMFIFYFGMLANITPPVAPDAFVAAGIAKTSPFHVAVQACRIAAPIYLLPFLMVYNPVILLQGGTYPIIEAFITGLLGAYAISSGFQGVMQPKTILNMPERLILTVLGVALLFPSTYTTIICVPLLALIQVWSFVKGRRQASAAPGGFSVEHGFNSANL